jgi:hypothetical protein
MTVVSNTGGDLIKVLITDLMSTLPSTFSEVYGVHVTKVLFRNDGGEIKYFTDKEEYSTLAEVMSGNSNVKIALFEIATDFLEMKYLSDSMAMYLRNNDLLDDYYIYKYNYIDKPKSYNGGYRRTKRTKRTRRHNHKK